MFENVVKLSVVYRLETYDYENTNQLFREKNIQTTTGAKNK